MSTFGAAENESKTLTFGSTASEGRSFGSSTSFSLSEATAKAGEEKPSLFGSGPPQKFGESGTAAAGSADDAEGAEGVPEAESTAEFTPVVQLDEVEVKTHEEDEARGLHIRAKLFRYTESLLNKGSGKKEWIERGVGEMKLLKHRESERIRVLMRQEKTMKVIANHVVDPRIELQPNVGNDRSWVWSCFDFSDGDLVEEVFAIRFANRDNAVKFSDAFLQAQDAMTKLLAGEDGPPDAEADAAADALKQLSATDQPPQKPAADDDDDKKTPTADNAA